MATRQRRIAEEQTPENRREYQGEDVAAPLVNWLNITTDEEGKQRIINVVSLFLRALAQSAKVKPDIYRGKKGYYERETPESKKRDSLEKELNKALSYYRMIPFVHISGQGQDVMTGWSAIPRSKMDREMHRALEANWKALSKEHWNIPGAQMGESGALKMALRVFESGLIWKIWRCRCGTFFFGKFRHQRFCSQKCRIAEFQSSEDARKKRNDYARMLYHRHKALDEGKVR
jgi:hypothetical protein